MTHIPECPLLTDLAQVDRKLASVTRERFCDLLLPEPGTNDYLDTFDGGYIIFMNDHGCTVRLTNKNQCRAHKHHRLLEPLARIELPAGFRLDINPGLKLNCSIFSAMRMAAIFNGSPLKFSDPHFGNLGAIPGKCINSFFDYSMVIDPGAVDKRRASTGRFASLVAKLIAANDNNEEIQEKAYSNLRHAFSDAVESGSVRKMRQAWLLCHKARQEGYLLSDWVNNKIGFVHPAVAEQAQNYSARLDHLKPKSL